MTGFTWVAVLLVLVTATGILITRDWRVILGLLGLQFVGVFWLTTQHWPVSMAATKLVTGWMAIATLGVTHLSAKTELIETETFWPQGWSFRLFTTGVIVILVITTAPQLENIIPGIGLPVITGSLFLIGLGMLHLGLTNQPFRVIIGLLTVLAGFEALYASLESSILVAAMLSTVNLGLALIGAYLLTVREPENEEPL